MGYLPDPTIAAFKGAYNLGLFFRVDTSPALTIWYGVHDIPAVIPSVDVSGTIYLGAGLIADIPDAIEVLINGTADRADWIMSGVDPTLTANIDGSAPSVVGKRVSFGVASMDARWQMLSDIIVMWEGTADFWAETQPLQADPNKPKTRTLTLATTTGDASRALGFYATWTKPIQRIISATDLFCDRTPRYYQGQIIRWPAY